MRKILQHGPEESRAHTHKELASHYLRARLIADNTVVVDGANFIMVERVQRKSMLGPEAVPLHDRLNVMKPDCILRKQGRQYHPFIWIFAVRGMDVEGVVTRAIS